MKPVTFEGKTYQFPDDATPEEIAGALNEHHDVAAPAAQAAPEAPSEDTANPQNSLWDYLRDQLVKTGNVVQGAGRATVAPLLGAAQKIEQGVRAVPGGDKVFTDDDYATAQDLIDRNKQALGDLRNQPGGLIGQMAGGAGTYAVGGGALGAMKLPAALSGAGALYNTAKAVPVVRSVLPVVNAAGAGAAYGASQPVASDETASGNMVLSALMGAGGRVAGNALSYLGGAVKPLGDVITQSAKDSYANLTAQGVTPNVNQLVEGVPLTFPQRVAKLVGTAIGSPSATTQSEDLAKAVAKQTGLPSLSRQDIAAGLDEAGSRIGNAVKDQTINLNNPTTIKAVEEFRAKQAALPEASQSKKSLGYLQDLFGSKETVDNPEALKLITQMKAQNFDDTTITKVLSQYQIPRTIENSIPGKYPTGELPGELYQTIRSGIGEDASKAFKSDTDSGTKLNEVKSILDDAAQASLPPKQADALIKARNDYQMRLIAQDSLGNTNSGTVKPADLATALERHAPKEFASLQGKDGPIALSQLAQSANQLLIKQPSQEQTALHSAAAAGGHLLGIPGGHALGHLAIAPSASRGITSTMLAQYLMRNPKTPVAPNLLQTLGIVGANETQ
jgi:hypothetical protein